MVNPRNLAGIAEEESGMTQGWHAGAYLYICHSWGECFTSWTNTLPPGQILYLLDKYFTSWTNDKHFSSWTNTLYLLDKWQILHLLDKWQILFLLDKYFTSWTNDKYFSSWTNTLLPGQIEGSRPEWCISSMIYSGDTPFWSETLEIHLDKYFTSWTSALPPGQILLSRIGLFVLEVEISFCFKLNKRKWHLYISIFNNLFWYSKSLNWTIREAWLQENVEDFFFFF